MEIGKDGEKDSTFKGKSVKVYVVFFILFLVLFISLGFAHYFLSDLFFPKEYRSIVKKYSEEFMLDPLLVSSIIYTESHYNPSALSPKGAEGLMQILPSTAEQIKKMLKIDKNTKIDLDNPETNIRFGCYYFRMLLSRYGDDVSQALAAYNAGGRNVTKWKESSNQKDFAKALNDHGFIETKRYVENVLRINRILHNLNSIKSL